MKPPGAGLGSQPRAGFVDRFEYTRLERLDFFVAQSAVGRLKRRADQ